MTYPDGKSQILRQLVDQKAIDQADKWKDESLWPALNAADRELLATLFTLQGEDLLQKSDLLGLASYEVACKAAPFSAKIMTDCLNAFLRYCQDTTHLKECLQQAEAFSQKYPQELEVAFLKAELLFKLACFEGQMSLMEQAEKSFANVHKLWNSPDQKEGIISPTTYPGTFLWKWGRACYELGKLSGEPNDFYSAVEKYKQSLEMGLIGCDFFFDFGNAISDLSHLLGRPEMLVEALGWYKRSLKEGLRSSLLLTRLAITLQQLYSLDKKQETFQEAAKVFKEAVHLDTENCHLWLSWGQLLMVAGRQRKQFPLVEDALEKFERAYACASDEVSVILAWSEALLIAGVHSEKVDYLKEGYDRLTLAMLLAPDRCEVWALIGACLNELGAYFQEGSYYVEAIEKFQQGLTLSRTFAPLWYGLATSYFALGDMRADITLFEKALRCYSQLAEFAPEGSSEFWNDWGVALMKLGELTNERTHFEQELEKFDHAIALQLRRGEDGIEAEWLYNYGCALDFLGDFTGEALYYEQAIQVLSRVLTIDPEYPYTRYNLALALSHLGEITSDLDCFHRALEIFEGLVLKDAEDEYVWNDWGLTLVHYAILIRDPAHPDRAETILKFAEQKFLQAISLGNPQGLYNLACIYALVEKVEVAIHFLEKAARADALPTLDDLMEDEWLDPIRETPEFRTFLEQAEKKD